MKFEVKSFQEPKHQEIAPLLDLRPANLPSLLNPGQVPRPIMNSLLAGGYSSVGIEMYI
jgi:hypothetical protein